MTTKPISSARRTDVTGPAQEGLDPARAADRSARSGRAIPTRDSAKRPINTDQFRVDFLFSCVACSNQSN